MITVPRRNSDNTCPVAIDRAAAAIRKPSRLKTVLSALVLAAQSLSVGWMAYLVLRDETGWPQQAYVFLLFGLLALLVYGVTRRPAFSLGLAALLFIAIHRLSMAKFEHLQAPLLVDDVQLLLRPEILDLLLHGYPRLAWLFLGGLAVFIAWGVVAIRFEPSRPLRGHRWASLGIVVVAVAGFGLVIPGPGPLSSATAEETETSLANSELDPISRFFASSLHNRLKRPVFAAPRTPWLAINTAASPAAAVTRPDIVLVLEESTFDPQAVLPFCTPAICQRAMMTGLPNSTAVGPLRAHIVGGLTWLSEFALFTGMPHSLFGVAGQYAPMRVLPHVKYTLPRWLKTLGYRAVVVYPVDKHTYGASLIYPMYGFDEVLAHPLILSGRSEGFWDLSDRQLFDQIREVIAAEDAKSERAPLFIFVITIQQHGPHGWGLDGQPPRDDRPTFPGIDKELNAKLNDYLTRLDWSAEAIRELDAALARRGRPYVLAHFGDHQPSFEGALRNVPKRTPLPRVPGEYVTYFNIQAGGGLPLSGYRMATAYPVLDLALLGGMILDVAGLPANPYFAANIRLRERCDGLFVDCADKDALAAYQQYIFDELGAVAF